MNICIVCPGYNEKNYRLQPWRYIYEISKHLGKRGLKVSIITDGYSTYPSFEENEEVSVYRLRSLRSSPFVENRAITQLIKQIDPKIVFWALGFTSIQGYTTIKALDKPVLGLWMGTRFKVMQILSIGLKDIVSDFSSVYLFFINALIPKRFFLNLLELPNFKKIITLSDHGKQQLLRLGVQQAMISVIPPGIEDYDLKTPGDDIVSHLKKKNGIGTDDFVILYFGSPLSLRGTSTLIKALSIVRSQENIKLIILSRKRDGSLERESKAMIELIYKLKLDNSVTIVNGFLDRDMVKTYIRLSDVVVLPFKLIQAETPISILEVMALGRPVISTRICGITELLEDDRGYLVPPSNCDELALAIDHLSMDPKLRERIGNNARKFMLSYSKWDSVGENIAREIMELSE
jgi:glycosyltransferase involved in cell wall biosynthesis